LDSQQEVFCTIRESVMELEIGERLTLLVSSGMVVLFKLVTIIIAYKVIKLGYDLLLKGVKGEFEFSTTSGVAKANLKSASPGLLFIILGCILIAITVMEKYPQESTKIVYEPSVEKPTLNDGDMEID
jgi:hypothetical protein